MASETELRTLEAAAQLAETEAVAAATAIESFRVTAATQAAAALATGDFTGLEALGLEAELKALQHTANQKRFVAYQARIDFHIAGAASSMVPDGVTPWQHSRYSAATTHQRDTWLHQCLINIRRSLL